MIHLSNNGMSKTNLPSVVFNNINSLGLTAPGGFTGRKAKVINLLASLVTTHDITCLQDIRIPSKDLISELQPFFPHFKFFVCSSDDTNKGGALIIVSPKINKDYDIEHVIVYKGNIHHITLTNKLTTTKLRIINCYLDASNNNIWKKQVNSLKHNINNCCNTLVGGDFNHVYNPQDRSGFHSDKTFDLADLYQSWLSKHSLQQIEQNYHTWYGKRGGEDVASSKVDRVYHNFDYIALSHHTPKANICTYAPHTVVQYGMKCKYQNDKNFTRLIDNYRTKSEGGTHVTDHVPVSVRFSNPLNRPNVQFRTASLTHDEFITEFDKRWTNTMTGDSPFDNLKDYKNTLTSTSIAVCKITKKPVLKNTQLWDAVRLVNAIDQKDDNIDSKFSHIPDYLELRESPGALLSKINKNFAALALDDNGHTPISRIETISRSLPKKKDSITHFYDDTDDSITDDPVRMNEIKKRFWGAKWDKKQHLDPTELFKAYGKRLGIPPTPITLDTVKNAIINSNDSAVGPDGIPFAAYRLTLDFIAPILLDCINFLMKGGLPPEDFNGGLLLLLPKKNTYKVEDTRPLVINNTDNRLVATIIRDSIAPALDTVLSDDQNGFRDHRSTNDNINYYNEKFYGSMENREFYDILFVDFCKAFDSVSHDAIFKLLDRLGFALDYQNIIKSLFHNAYCYTDQNKTTTITFSSGVKQGCPLSPLLFIMVADVLIDMLDKVTGADIKFYADDAAVGAKNLVPKLSLIKDCFDVFGAHTGLVLNPSKSAVIATGGRTDLRKKLDEIGWGDIVISPNIKYLGVFMGHATTLDDNFKGPYDKMTNRLQLFSSVKHNYSIPKRVTIWNTWIIPIFSYIFNFYTLPVDYAHWIDLHCQKWLSQGNTFSSLHFTRPTALIGLASPLKDASLFNYSRLASLSRALPTNNNSPSWSLRITTHLAMARKHVQTEYGLKLHDGIDSNTIYTQIIHSQEQREEYMPYIKNKLDRAGLDCPQQRCYLNNFKRIPRWIPCYARYNNISITHNMLPTFRRFGEHSPCLLCGKAEDCAKHIYGHCTTVSTATARMRAALKLPMTPLSFAQSVGADSERSADDMSVQVMLANSVWRARSNAKKGDNRGAEAWAGWIVSDCIQRICSLSPSFFSTNFPNNTVPNRHKIIYKPDLGSSKRRSTDQINAATAVDAHINSLPPHTLLAFTDGSAKPNPGPAGAGAVILKKSLSDFSHCANYTAAIGCASNNTGELYAVGIVLEHCKLTKYKGNLHIYTDSKIAYGALRNGWRAGKANSDILFAVRAIAHDIRHSCNIHYHWIPGHSNVKFNDMADNLANAGSDFSKSHRCEQVNFKNSLNNNGFLALVTGTDTGLF